MGFDYWPSHWLRAVYSGFEDSFYHQHQEGRRAIDQEHGSFGIGMPHTACLQLHACICYLGSYLLTREPCYTDSQATPLGRSWLKDEALIQQASTPSDCANRVVLDCKNLLCQDSLFFGPPPASLSGTRVDQVPQLLLTQVLHMHAHRVSGSLALTPLHNILIHIYLRHVCFRQCDACPPCCSA